MPSPFSRSLAVRWEDGLLGFSGFVVVTCVALLPSTPGPRHLETPEAVVPMLIAFGLALFAVRLRKLEYGPVQTRRIVRDGGVGALVAAVISGWWVGLHLYTSTPVVGLTDQILTVVSGGLGAGVLVGRSAIDDAPSAEPPRGRRVVAETSWTNRSGPTPVLAAVVETLAELEDVEQTELDPVYEHADPEVLATLRRQDDTQWRYLLHTGRYEVGVSSAGTVTVYEAPETSEEPVTRPST